MRIDVPSGKKEGDASDRGKKNLRQLAQREAKSGGVAGSPPARIRTAPIASSVLPTSTNVPPTIRPEDPECGCPEP